MSSCRKLHFFLLEPYFGGSHKRFLQGLQAHSSHTYTLLSLPARKWKMRMQLAAPWFADRIAELVAGGTRADGIFSSSFVDVAVLKALLYKQGLDFPVAVYFHENQFAYPVRTGGAVDFQFAALNFSTALSADLVGFNSCYNMETFLAGVNQYLSKAVDMGFAGKAEQLARGCRVLYPGVEYGEIDDVARSGYVDRPPVLLWNHRWEHDKDPQRFFTVLAGLADEGIAFRLVVLGQSFRNRPDIFTLAKERFAGQLLHFGYAQQREKYVKLLRQGDIVVSTARHEFFGMAVLEAVRAGCTPLVPDRLAYRELFPERFRYDAGCFSTALRTTLRNYVPLAADTALNLTSKYSWPEVVPAYDAWLAHLAELRRKCGGCP